MSQIYASYLAKFIGNDGVHKFLLGLASDPSLVDWQKMWVLAALLQVAKAEDGAVKVALELLKDANRHDALRAVAATYVGRFGDHTRRKSLVTIYGQVSNYIQAAIYFTSRRWPAVERANAKAWSAHGPLHKLIALVK